MLREFDVLVDYFLEEISRIVIVKGQAPEHHLEEEDAHGPPVHGTIVLLVFHDLGSEVGLRADEGTHLVVPVVQELYHAEIGEVDVAVILQKNVL